MSSFDLIAFQWYGTNHYMIIHPFVEVFLFVDLVTHSQFWYKILNGKSHKFTAVIFKLHAVMSNYDPENVWGNHFEGFYSFTWSVCSSIFVKSVSSSHSHTSLVFELKIKNCIISCNTVNIISCNIIPTHPDIRLSSVSIVYVLHGYSLNNHLG